MNALRCTTFAAALALLVLAGGCAQRGVDRTYGKRRGAEGGDSVNGTAVLAGMFENAGYRVATWRRLSPRLDDFDVIVWAPDDFAPPSEEQREYLEEWLWTEGGRTLVYIARDYDAAPAYWKSVLPEAPPEQTMEVSRRLADANARYDWERSALPHEEACDWFTLRTDRPRREIRSVQGPWSDGVDAAGLEIEIGARTDVPDQQEIQAWVERSPFTWGEVPRFEQLLRSESDTLVSRVSLPEWYDSQLLVVVNGSFLLNLPLVNHEHRRLADKLIETCGPPGKVAFLESGAGGPLILDREPDTNAPTGFEIFTVWPAGAILMHLILLGITACFALFPIFGRPRQLAEGSTSDFGKHVVALGELLEATRDTTYAINRIQYYHAHVRREAGSALRRDQGRSAATEARNP